MFLNDTFCHWRLNFAKKHLWVLLESSVACWWIHCSLTMNWAILFPGLFTINHLEACWFMRLHEYDHLDPKQRATRVNNALLIWHWQVFFTFYSNLFYFYKTHRSGIQGSTDGKISPNLTNRHTRWTESGQITGYGWAALDNGSRTVVSACGGHTALTMITWMRLGRAVGKCYQNWKQYGSGTKELTQNIISLRTTVSLLGSRTSLVGEMDRRRLSLLSRTNYAII